jgi:predicted transcriptional regulator
MDAQAALVSAVATGKLTAEEAEPLSSMLGTAGLVACRDLRIAVNFEFRTKAAGEGKIVSVTWDCRTLRERLSDAGFSGDLRCIISDVVSVW